MASYKVSMENLVTFLLTALCFFCQTSNCQDYSSCGLTLRSEHRGKIFGGLESRPGMWPWQVAIFRRTSDEGQRPRFFCGGALINSRWVLSAAHCFHKRPSEKYIEYRYTIKAGDHKIFSKDPHEQERNAFRIYNHPNFVPSTYENDIALLELDTGVKMGPKVRSICLPKANENISSPGEIVSVAGWGFTTKGSHSSVLRYSAFEIQSNKNCKDTTRYLFNETVMFCAGHGQGGNDTCKGDSGGSTVREVLRDGRRRWVTVGLVSWGEKCGIKGKYGYYTRVEPFVNWIQKKVNGSILSCDDPSNIPNGRINGSDFLVGFTVKYKCNEGYRLRGRSRSRCKRNGKWTKAPTCRKVECRDPGRPRYGVRRPRRKKYHYNNKIRFRCKTNYTIIGRSAIVCRSDGMWSGFKPVCLAPCKDPGIPKGGTRLDHSFKHGQTVRFLCRKKNQPPSFSARTCNNGRWNHDIPSCISGCDDPGIPSNGKRRGNHFAVRKRLYFSCDRGFRLIGERHIQCQSNLQWSGKIPTCKPVECADPGKPKNGAKRENQNKYVYEDRIRFQCKKNYTLRGDSFIFCQRDATWTGTLPQCLAPCPDPGIPRGGSRLDHSFKHNDVVRFSCNPGWSMKGFNAIRCQNIRWDYSPPTCVAIGCGRLPELQHGKKVEETSTFFGGKVVFQCNKEGYQLKGSAQRVCQNNGTWSGERTSCKPVECNDPGKPANSVRRPDKSKFVFEDRIDFQCNTNHTMIGHPFIICQKNKTWTGDAPQCLAPCPDPGIPNGSYRRDHSFKHNNVVRFSCQRNWKMEGTHTIRCNNGRWDHETPKCLESCPRPNNTDNMYWSSRKNLYFSGEEVRFTCYRGYKRVGYQRITCLNGKWSSGPPACKRICSNPGRPNHGIISGFEFFEGKEIRFLCYSGYDLFGSQTLRCLPNGRWNASRPECKRRCYNPVIPSNGPTSTPPLVRGQRTKHSTTITFSCRPRYTLEGRQTIRCENGRWSDSNVPVCNAPCSDPGTLQYGRKYGSNFLHGNQVTYTCSGMYMLEGDTRLTCNNGYWDHPKPSCKEPCSNPGSPIKGSKIGSDYRHGKKVDYSCQRGTRLVGQSSLTCTDGRWSNTAPECLEICPVLGKPLYGQKIGKSESLSGDKVTFRCNSGFDLVGSAVLYCDQGQWNGSVPRCLAQCKVPYDLNSTISSSPSVAAGQLVQHHKILRFSCLNKKIELDGEEWIICDDGTWSDDFPKCKVPCNTDSGSVTNGRKHGTRFFVQYRCNIGYTLKGNSNITCINGKWSSGPPTCERARCPDPGTPLNGRRKGNNFTHGMTVEFSCDNGYHLEPLDGNQFIKCSNGIWSGSTPTCDDCGIPLGMESRKIPDSNIQASSTRWYYYAKYGRLNGPKAWCSGSEREPYLQIDFGKPYRITGLATQGSVYGNKWVESYILQSNLAGNYFSVYSEESTDKMFKANTDSRTIVRQKLKNNLIARRIKINPVKLGGFYASPACMRVEVYGCDLPSDCILIGSRIVAKWESYPRGGYVYYKAYLTSISRRYWRVELESDGRPKYFQKYDDLPFVLDVPPKHEEVQVGTRVLAPWAFRYYTSTIKTGRDRYNRYRVRADDGLTSCGVRSVFQRTRIAGGRRSYQGQWPWQVAIFHTNGRTGRKQFHCGGALIHSRWVLTAAHCFDYDADPRSYTIIAGDHDISVKDSKEQERQIRKIITHPGYRDDTLENDIALIGVSQNINLTTDFVSTVCLPEAGDNLSTPGAVVHVAGWGRIREGGPSSAILLHSAYQIQNNNICRRAKGVNKFNQTVMFCAGDGKGGNDTCQGDSGGSLIRKVPRNGRYRWVTVGLVSWGKGCARPGKYGYNTRVEPFVNWIRKAMICDLSLGMEDAVIPDGNIRSSSAIDQYHTAKEGRLNGPRAWCARRERNPYLEIDLGKSYIITGLATQGSAYDNKWVANYTMRGNLVGSTLYSYRELRIEKVFVGNADEVSVVKHRLKNPFIGKKLRIYPVKKEGYSTSSACMRVEIYGCDLPSGCVIPGTRVVAKWPTIHKDGYIYLRGYLTEISFASWRVDLENENHAKNRFIYYSKIFDLAFVLDVPPRQRELRRNSRVLAPRGYTYITGTVEVRQRDFKYRVLADDGKRGSFTKDQLRLLKMPSVCN